MKNIFPLKNVRVVELGSWIAGPYCGRILASLGAEVIKIERPGVGDISRYYQPFLPSSSLPFYNRSGYFLVENSGKKSMTLNLKHKKGKELFLKLVKKTDVIIENFRPGTMKSLGLDYFEVLKKINKKLIYAAISGFGQYGPYKEKPCYGPAAEAFGGLMSIVGWPDSPPTRCQTPISDYIAALYTATAILAALRARDLYGTGQFIDISLVDSVISIMPEYYMMYSVDRKICNRIGNRSAFVYPFDTFKAEDGWVFIGCTLDREWEMLCKIIEREDLLKDKRFSDVNKRAENYAILKQIIDKWTAKRKRSEICDLLNKNRIPCTPVLSIDEVCNDPHIKTREMFTWVYDEELGKIPLINIPIKMSETKLLLKSAPRLGQHTREILSKLLDLDDLTISKLYEENVI